MGKIIFYKDTKDTFECDIKVEGTSLAKSRARLVLEFNDRSLLFEGSISDNGHVKVEIPTLHEINHDEGKAILEVIAESTFFEAWSSAFSLRKKKSVSVNEVHISNSEDRKIMVENISTEKKTKIREQVVPRKEKSIYIEGCSDKNRLFVTKSFNGFKSKSSKERKIIKESLNSYTPNSVMKKWAKGVFNDTNTTYAKLCMMELQNGLKKLGE